MDMIIFYIFMLSTQIHIYFLIFCIELFVNNLLFNM